MKEPLEGMSLGFLMGVTYRKMAALLQLRLKDYDITPEQWSLLYHIDRSPGMIQKEIADKTYKDKPATTRILDHLESKGLIYKEAGVQDRRSYLVYCTERGHATIRETIPVEEGLTEEVKRLLTEEQYSLMIALLQRINNYATERLDIE